MAKKTQNGGPRSRRAETIQLLKQGNTSPVESWKGGKPVFRKRVVQGFIPFSERIKVVIPDLDGCPIE